MKTGKNLRKEIQYLLDKSRVAYVDLADGVMSGDDYLKLKTLIIDDFESLITSIQQEEREKYDEAKDEFMRKLFHVGFENNISRNQMISIIQSLTEEDVTNSNKVMKDKIIQITTDSDDNGESWLVGMSENGNLYSFDYGKNAWKFVCESPNLQENVKEEGKWIG